jgi:tetratricopeptide (TPR) repeat protein
VTLGEKLRAARLEHRLTQEQVGGTDFSKAYISELERGVRTPRVTTLKILAKRLHQPLSHFLDGVPEEGEPEALLTLGLACLHAGSPSDARSFLERGLALAAEQGDEALQARFELALAGIDVHLGRLPGARRRIERSLGALKRTRDQALLARAQVYLGYVKLDEGDVASALWTFEAARRLLARHDRDAALLVDLHVGLGEACRRLGRTEEARDAFRRALEVAAPFEDQHRVAARHLQLAIAAAGRGDFEDAGQQAAKALALYDAMAHRRRLAEIRQRLGEADLLAGRWEEAQEHYRWSVALQGTAVNHHGAVQMLGCLVEAMLERGSPEIAQAVGNAALSLLTEGDGPEARAHTLRLRGTLCRLLGRTAEARTALEDSLRLFQELHRARDARYVRRELALLAIDVGDAAEARRQVKILQDAPTDRAAPAGL